jgi:putative transposase
MKLGIAGITRSTIVNILKEKGLPRGPKRDESTWGEFLARHAKTLWACDFISRRILTPRGIRVAFALVFVHPKTRRAHVSAATLIPDSAWMAQAVSGLVRSLPKGTPRPKLMLCDSDSKYGKEFDRTLGAAGITGMRPSIG